MKPTEDLTPNEVVLAATHGILRRKEKLEGKRTDRAQNGRSSWDNEIEGACAELWYSKWRERYWSGVSHLKASDCGNEEVRWTRHLSTGGLIVYPHDVDNAKLILLEGFAPRYLIVGWLWAYEGKEQQFLAEYGYYLVPRNRLRKVDW
jgi:hypothetical protein